MHHIHASGYGAHIKCIEDSGLYILLREYGLAHLVGKRNRKVAAVYRLYEQVDEITRWVWEYSGAQVVLRYLCYSGGCVYGRSTRWGIVAAAGANIPGCTMP